MEDLPFWRAGSCRRPPLCRHGQRFLGFFAVRSVSGTDLSCTGRSCARPHDILVAIRDLVWRAAGTAREAPDDDQRPDGAMRA